MLLPRILPFAAVLAAVACATNADVLQLDPTPRPPTNPESMQLIGQEPKRPYVVIGIVSAQPGEIFALGTDFDHVRNRLIKEAARLGGNAILFEGGSLTRVGVGGEYGGTMLQLSGKIIVYTDTTRADSSRAN